MNVELTPDQRVSLPLLKKRVPLPPSRPETMK